MKQINQKQILKQWMGVSRLCYNYAVELLQNKKYSFYDLRKKVITRLEQSKPFTKLTPFDIRAGAVKDAHIAFQTAKDKSFSTKKKHTVSFRSKKDNESSIFIPRATVKKQAIYTSYLKKLKSSSPFESAKHDCRLSYKRHSGYYLLIPQAFSTEITENQGKFGKLIALDPGVRTFMTCYSQEACFEFGARDIGKINRLQYHLRTLTGSRKRKAASRLRKKIKDLVTEVHWKVAKFLCQNYENILIPEFRVSQMVKKEDRKLNKTTVKSMLSWSHYAFRMRLIHQAKKYGTCIWVTNESYTSKTCTRCGEINPTLGSSKTFNCGKCGLKIGRDVGGARNIYIRALVDSPVLV